MDPYKKQELRLMFRESNEVTFTVEGYDDKEPFDETHDNFEECLQAIEHYEQTAQVYI